MVQFATFSDLNRFTGSLNFSERTLLESQAPQKNNKDTFLSHSSKDAEYLPGVIKLLENHGASVYCDLADDRMPDNPNPETAQIIKSQIHSSRKLVVFVTVNCKDSKWVPWELGVGDSSLTSKNVALLPVADKSYEQSWAKQEYLGLYRHIVYGNMKGEPENIWMVYDHISNTATKLGEWCRG